MKRFSKSIGVILVLASTGYLALTFQRSYRTLPEIHWTVALVASIIAGVLFFFLLFLLLAYAWKVLLTSGGEVISFAIAFDIMGRSQIAKYIPGNIFHYAGRVGLAHERGISTGGATIATGIETLLLLTVCSILISVAGWSNGSHLDVNSQLGKMVVSTPSEILFGVIVVTGVVLLSKANVREWLLVRKQFLSARGLIISSLLYLGYFVPIGLMLKFIVWSVWQVESPSWVELTWGFALAWVLGFVIPGVSGGIGVREAVFVGLFESQMGAGLAVGLAVLLRFITILSDLLTFAIASISSYYQRSSMGNSTAC
jgi:hypothetical protein